MKNCDIELMRCIIRDRIKKDTDIDISDYDDNFNSEMARIYQAYPEEDIIKIIDKLFQEELYDRRN